MKLKILNSHLSINAFSQLSNGYIKVIRYKYQSIYLLILKCTTPVKGFLHRTIGNGKWNTEQFAPNCSNGEQNAQMENRMLNSLHEMIRTENGLASISEFAFQKLSLFIILSINIYLFTNI
jgi:hypothetical protein